MRDTRIFFKLGELVQLKQDIPNKPIMMVGKIPKSRRVMEDAPSVLIGVICFWFTEDKRYQERLFSTKDLEKVKPQK